MTAQSLRGYRSEDVVIVAGAQQALSLMARIVLDEGANAFIEGPHYQLAAYALLAHSARVTCVCTDDGTLHIRRPSR